MWEDLAVRGGLAGLIGGVGDFAVHHLGLLFFKTTTTAHYIAELIFPNRPVTPIRYAYGLFTHFTAGMAVGILVALVLAYSGYRRAYPKSLALGALTWVIHVAVIPNLVAPRPYLYRTEAEAAVDLLAHLAFGAAVVWYLRRTVRIPQTEEGVV